MAATPLARPETSTGAALSEVVPSPSSPWPLLPQHLTPPALVRAQVWAPPAAMVATPLARPETSPGVVLHEYTRLFTVHVCGPELVPLPSWPKPLPPQHLTLPIVVRAQVWMPPAAMAAMPLLRPEASTGVVLQGLVP